MYRSVASRGLRFAGTLEIRVEIPFVQWEHGRWQRALMNLTGQGGVTERDCIYGVVWF